ncbi:MAG TPA: hypothetical protein VF210_06540 [Pseudomonadales bacterium]
MKKSPFVLLGVGAVVLSLTAVPLTARADHEDAALAFVAGAVVGHVIADHDHRYRPSHRRHHHEPVIRRVRSQHWHASHPSHRPVVRAHWKHHHKHDHRCDDRRHRHRGWR